MNRADTSVILPLDAMTTSGAMEPQELDNLPRQRRHGICGLLNLFICGAHVELDGDTGSTSSSRQSGLATRNKLRKPRTVTPSSPRHARPARRVANRSWWACANCMGGYGFRSPGGEMGRGRLLRSDESYRTVASDLPPPRLVSAERLNWFRAT